MMKKLKLLSVFAMALLAVGTLFVSCGSDDDDQEPNTITNSRGTAKITGVRVNNFNDQYTIHVIAPYSGARINIAKTEMGKRIDFSKPGYWDVDTPSIVANGQKETLKSGSYLNVTSFGNGKITLSYRLVKASSNGDIVEKGNYSGPVTVGEAWQKP